MSVRLLGHRAREKRTEQGEKPEAAPQMLRMKEHVEETRHLKPRKWLGVERKGSEGNPNIKRLWTEWYLPVSERRI